MKFFILAALVVVIGGWGMAQFAPGKGLRAVGRVILLLTVLVFVGLIIGCFGIMIAAPHGSNSGFLMFPALIFGFFVWLFWGAWTTTREWDKIADKSDAEKLAWLEEKSEEMSANLREDLERDRAELAKFWVSPSRRRKLRARVAENEFLLKHAETMDDRYRAHIEKKAADLKTD